MEDLYAHLRERGDVGWDRVMRSPREIVDPEPGSYQDITRTVLFGDIWQRPHLTLRERRLIVLTLLAVYGRDDPLGYHLAGALRSGDLDPDALHEIVIQLAFYAGWPAASTFFTATGRAVEAWRREQASGQDPTA